MAEHMRSAMNKSNKFYGTLVTCPSAGVRISTLETGEFDERYFTLRKSDFDEDATLALFNGTMPLLSEDEILYPDQAVLALFGPDAESVQLASRQIKLETVPLEAELTGGTTDSLTIGSPKADETEDGETRIVRSTVTLDSVAALSPVRLVCECWSEGEKIHIEVPCQWPAMIRRNVARLLGKDETDVVVHQMPYQSRHDEYLIQPAILACIGAKATVKAGLPVVLQSHASAVSPKVTVERTTSCSVDGKPLDEECTMTAFLGAFTLDDEEYTRQALAGLVPNYPLRSFKATVEVRRSMTFPSLIHCGAGYSDALFSTERHATVLADSFETPPAKWKEYVMEGKRPFTDYMPSADFAQLARLDDKMVEESDFNRKWASYRTQNGDFTLLPFNRGIALSGGFSIAGFSTTHSKENETQARITLTEKGNVTLLTSFPDRDHFHDIVTKTVQNELDLDESKDVIILDNDGTMTDSGPDILCRSTGHFPLQLANACAKLNLEAKELPCSVVFGCDETLMPCEFEQRGMAAVIVETKIDNITFIPVVLEAWVTVASDTSIRDKDLNSIVRKTVAGTLEDCGAILSTDPQRPFRVNITRKDWTGGSLTSLTQALCALTRASFASALKMSLPSITDTLPADSVALEKAYRERGNNEN